MTLRPVTDPAPAAWLVGRGAPWPRLSLFGPVGYEAYARLRFAPDPGQPSAHHDEDDPQAPAPSELSRLRTALTVLARHTTTPDQAWFCLWDGWGDLHEGAVVLSTIHDDGTVTSQPGRPAFPPSVLGPPVVHHPHRSHHLFRGRLSDLGDWGAEDLAPGVPRGDLVPSFVWPDDRAWCVARDVDPHWAGIGASQAAVDDLCAREDLDVVPADPAEPQPFLD